MPLSSGFELERGFRFEEQGGAGAEPRTKRLRRGKAGATGSVVKVLFAACKALVDDGPNEVG